MNKYHRIHPLILVVTLSLFPVVCLGGQFKVVRVYDGDTLKAVGHDIEIKVRLAGIDAPETSKKKHQPGQPFSQQAKKGEMVIAQGKTERVVDRDGTEYFRLVLGAKRADLLISRRAV